MNCPYCQAPLSVTDQPGGQPAVCPHCLSNLADPGTAPAGVAPNFLRDIRRDDNRKSWIGRMGSVVIHNGACCMMLGIGLIVAIVIVFFLVCVPLMKTPQFPG
jgi:hypothetical protein